MTRRVANAVRLFLAVQRRSGFIHIYFGVAVFTIVVVRVFLPRDWWPILVPALLLGEYGTMGVFMVAAQRFLERNEGSHEALSVTPLRHREHVWAMVLAPSLVAIVAGMSVFAGTLGIDARLAWLLAPLFATTLLAGSVGLIVASRYAEFTRFLLGSIPVVTVFSLPFLSYFELVPRYTFAWLPGDAALFSFANVARDDPDPATYALLGIELLVFTAIGLFWAERAGRLP